MGVDSKHPLYNDHIEDWHQLRDTYRGERHVKQRGRVYLPATSGMIADGIDDPSAKGWKAYDAYRKRAHFPDVVKQAVEAMLGVMHHKPPVIELPPQMEPMIERATLRGESIEMLLRRINEEQLVMGRVGLLLDVVDSSRPELPYIALYHAEDIINWDDGRLDGSRVEALNLVTLEETEYERTQGQFEWERQAKYRVLVLGDLGENELPNTGAIYRVATFRDQELHWTDEAAIEPQIAGTTLQEIPFVFVNSKDIEPTPDEPPLLGLSNLALTIYRGEADYRQALFMQGQDTLVVIGGEEGQEYRTGANASIAVPIGGDAKYIGVDSQGLSEMREALTNDRAAAGRQAGELVNETSGQRESGDALRIRVAARTATLNQIALAGAFGLQEILRKAARWLGVDPEGVVVTPNVDFVDDTMSGEELVKLITAKSMGAPISLETIHLQMENRGISEISFEEELGRIEQEMELELRPQSSNPDGPEADPEGEEQPEDADEGSDDESPDEDEQ